MKKYILLFVYLLLPAVNALAAPAPIAFKIIPASSHIKFEATQGGSPIKGEFKTFSADINFHPEALSSSKVKVTIDISSYSVADKDANDSLKGAEWFNVSAFPQAIFESASFKSLGDKRYEAAGNLTIKGHTEPVTLTFTLSEFSAASAAVTGETIIKRKAFKIGEDNTDSVKDEVRVSIDIKADATK